MVTPQAAEKLARDALQRYVNACGCNTPEDSANVMMKLVSMCGLAMCAVVGQPEAVDRLQGTTDYIAQTQSGVQWRTERAN
ncbi:hypothetical protein [uncultured Thiodictyon sp.]|uniref:hypothetical protein n=1 Tax=uncultured Thiodictyon sp. TaxID=1846217 RepID=UPI0025EE9506|nr:hypothetical protein [uncultured Thiodictyon sp.]